MTYTPDTPLEALAGIGPKKAQAFQKLGVATLRDLAGLYPRRYEDRTQFRTGQKMDGFGVAGIVCEIAALVLLQLPAPAKRKG